MRSEPLVGVKEAFSESIACVVQVIPRAKGSDAGSNVVKPINMNICPVMYALYQVTPYPAMSTLPSSPLIFIVLLRHFHA